MDSGVDAKRCWLGRKLVAPKPERMYSVGKSVMPIPTRWAARRLQTMVSNTAHILGIELLAAAQGIDFLRPLHSSQALEAVHALLRTHIPKMKQDRYLAPDIAHATALVESGALAKILRTLPALPALWITA